MLFIEELEIEIEKKKVELSELKKSKFNH